MGNATVYIVYDTTDAGDCDECRQNRILSVYANREDAEAWAEDWQGWAVAERAVDDTTDHAAAERDALLAALREIRDDDLFDGGTWDWAQFLERHGVAALLEDA